MDVEQAVGRFRPCQDGMDSFGQPDTHDEGIAKMSEGCVNGVRRGVLLLSVITLYGCQDLAIRDTSSLLVPRFRQSEVLGFVGVARDEKPTTVPFDLNRIAEAQRGRKQCRVGNLDQGG